MSIKYKQTKLKWERKYSNFENCKINIFLFQACQFYLYNLYSINNDVNSNNREQRSLYQLKPIKKNYKYNL